MDVPVRELVAAGGIAVKDPMTVQIYADVCNREIQIAAAIQSGALGSAVLGLGRVWEKRVRPDPANAAAYEELFLEYKRLHDYFGCGAPSCRKTGSSEHATTPEGQCPSGVVAS